jgi:SAM-dependent methyltransferase
LRLAAVKIPRKSLALACPQCRGKLDKGLRCSSCGARFSRKAGIPMLLPRDLPEDMLRSIRAWDLQWAARQGAATEVSRVEYERDYLQDTLRQVLEVVDPRKHRRYLEIGCGPGFLGVELARRGFQVGGLDCCFEALKLAKDVYRKAGQKADFVGGDLHHLPLAEGSVDFLYGGGVIEHFDDTLGALRELNRVLAPGGVSFNTVPYVSVGSFTYRQLWGNIPDLPILRPLFKFIHVRLLGGGHLKFGHEMSFTARKMVRLHRLAGFSRVTVRRFEVYLPLYFLPSFLRPLARRLTRFRPFWPMIAVVAVK